MWSHDSHFNRKSGRLVGRKVAVRASRFNYTLASALELRIITEKPTFAARCQVLYNPFSRLVMGSFEWSEECWSLSAMASGDFGQPSVGTSSTQAAELGGSPHKFESSPWLVLPCGRRKIETLNSGQIAYAWSIKACYSQCEDIWIASPAASWLRVG